MCVLLNTKSTMTFSQKLKLSNECVFIFVEREVDSQLSKIHIKLALLPKGCYAILTIFNKLYRH